MDFITIIILIVLLEVSFLVYKTLPTVGTRRKGGLLLDTSALMDGRIVTAAQTGFIPSRLIVPRSVVNELQLLADQADHEKRSRARRGLDAIKEMQDMDHIIVDMVEDGTTGQGGVDERLIELAKQRDAAVCTIDFNLNKAATALGVRVLNINELAGSLRMAFLPGETISLALTQKGQSGDQAVGYLADGTMVVVDKARSMVGQTAEIEFVRSLQTAAGRMMFAKLIGGEKVVKPVLAKTSGRNPVRTDSKAVVSTERSTTSRQSPAGKAQPAKNQTRNRRKTNEDNLLDLVNKQS